VISLPPHAPGTPDTRSPARLLLWVGRRQARTLVAGSLVAPLWMLPQALLPLALGRAVDRGVAPGDLGQVATWAGVLLCLLAVQVIAGVLAHRLAVSSWLQAALGTSHLLGHHVAGVGTAMPRRLPTGEVVSTVARDAVRFGDAFEVLHRCVAAVVSFGVVAVLLLGTDPVLGLVVLLGVPATAGLVALVVRPLSRRQHAQREAAGRLTTLGADTVAGLRVLRGVGGEGVFLARYRERSQQVRRAGEHVAGVQATLDALQVLLPGGFVVLVTWLGARAAVAGTITVGDLVALYGWAAFLVLPLRTATETLEQAVSAHVAARRVLAVLTVEPAVGDPDHPAPEPPAGSALADPSSGLVARPGLLTGVVGATPGDIAGLADRLGRLGGEGPAAELGGVPLDRLPVATVRRRVVVADTDAGLFTGPLRRGLDPQDRHDDDVLLAALATACAGDVLDALADGLSGEVTERGRALSGGQRQRVALARALLTGADVLVLVEPTSAVDAHTEAAVASRLRAHRGGSATVLVTTSPLLLDACDVVALVDGGRVVATGAHAELRHRDDAAGRAYRRAVLRDNGDDPRGGDAVQGRDRHDRPDTDDRDAGWRLAGVRT
jgi:ABC-type multidrug transport system fused ATPase/permease subunit